MTIGFADTLQRLKLKYDLCVMILLVVFDFYANSTGR